MHVTLLPIKEFMTYTKQQTDRPINRRTRVFDLVFQYVKETLEKGKGSVCGIFASIRAKTYVRCLVNQYVAFFYEETVYFLTPQVMSLFLHGNSHFYDTKLFFIRFLSIFLINFYQRIPIAKYYVC